MNIEDIKNILREIPSVELADDMTAPSMILRGHKVVAVSRQVSPDRLTKDTLGKEFGGKTVALYQFYELGLSLNEGRTIHVLRFGIIPNNE